MTADFESYELVEPRIADRFRGFLPVVVDVETGGFNHQTDALLEIAAVMIEMTPMGELRPGATHRFHVQPFHGSRMDPASLAVNGIDGEPRRRRAREAIAKVGLEAIAHRPARVLSGGEQQRLALARAWALEPDILFLDEPTASLDPGAAGEVERIVAAIAAEGTRIVMTTHNLGQARRLADEIVFIHQGRVAEQTPADRFFAEPQSQHARHFLKGELPWN